MERYFEHSFKVIINFMKTSDFYFHLPENLIAQTPIEPRDHSKLLHLNRNDGKLSHLHFYDILDFFNEGDTLVLNNSRVLPARLYGKKAVTGANIELLLLEQKEHLIWETLVKPGKKALVGAKIIFSDELEGEIIDILPDKNRLIKFTCNGNFYEVLDRLGHMPLPPYITEKLNDKERYQTVYSKENGSAAAPTAGLHFTDDLLERIKERGVNIAYVTLHVGLGTFRPVKVDDIHSHKMHSEHYSLPQETADLINSTHKNGKRVFAVGTTSCRTLESAASQSAVLTASEGYTDIFIYPGYEFKAIDGLITNFHLPESTLIMLVSAFSGYNSTMNAYKVAVEEKYRFFSFGDAMIIV